MDGFDKWHEEARNEFKDSRKYTKDIGEGFSVVQNGNVYVDGGNIIAGAVTPYRE